MTLLALVNAVALHVRATPRTRRIGAPTGVVCAAGGKARSTKESSRTVAPVKKDSWFVDFLRIFAPADDHGIDWTATASPFSGTMASHSERRRWARAEQAPARSARSKRAGGANTTGKGSTQQRASELTVFSTTAQPREEENLAHFVARGVATVFSKADVDENAFEPSGVTPGGWTMDKRGKSKALRMRLPKLSVPNK
jgi:hypothetical protein